MLYEVITRFERANGADDDTAVGQYRQRTDCLLRGLQTHVGTIKVDFRNNFV